MQMDMMRIKGTTSTFPFDLSVKELRVSCHQQCFILKDEEAMYINGCNTSVNTH
jgi:hypothetical protein